MNNPKLLKKCSKKVKKIHNKLVKLDEPMPKMFVSYAFLNKLNSHLNT